MSQRRLCATTTCPSRAPTDLQGWVRRPWTTKLFCARISPCLSPPTPLGQRHSYERRRNSAASGQLKDPRTPTLDSGLRKNPQMRVKARKTRNQVALRAKRPRAQCRQSHCCRKWKARAPPTASKERSSMTSMQKTATQRERPLSTQNRRGRMCHCRQLQQIQHPYQSVVRPKKSFTYNVVFPSDSNARAHVPDADWQTPPADECGIRKRGRNKRQTEKHLPCIGDPPVLVNDQREANRFHT